MQEQIAATLAILEAVDRTALGDDGDRPVSFGLPNGMIFDMSTLDYVRDWAAPQFAFHTVAAYAVRPHTRVPLGKADYIGYTMRYLRPGVRQRTRLHSSSDW